LTDGIILVATIVGWALLVDWLGYHVPRFERLVHRKSASRTAASRQRIT